MKIKNLKLKINQKGFTLIELLVVIAIIGILASFAVASFTNAQAKGRDSKRKGDLDAIRKALELAKTDSMGGSYYPSCEIYNASERCVFSNISTEPDLSPSYIKNVPTDPIGGGDCDTTLRAYCYAPAPPSCTGFSGATPCTGYNLLSCLENSNEPLGANVKSLAPFCTRLLWIPNP